MALVDILTHVAASSLSTVTTNVAIGIAQRHDAHLIGVYVYPRLSVPVGFAADIPQEFIDMQRDALEEQAAAAKGSFAKACAQAGIRCEWRTA
jgi:hypothetical protein